MDSYYVLNLPYVGSQLPVDLLIIILGYEGTFLPIVKKWSFYGFKVADFTAPFFLLFWVIYQVKDRGRQNFGFFSKFSKRHGYITRKLSADLRRKLAGK